LMTGRIPIHSALWVVVVPGDENGLTKNTATMAEFFQKNGYSTYKKLAQVIGSAD
jgi:arylsulfatase A-like enzyme